MASSEATSDLGETEQASGGSPTYVQHSSAPPPAPETEASPPAADEKPPAGPLFTVAEGCTVHCLKGPIVGGEPIRAMDLAGGQEALDELVKSEHVVDNRPQA